MVSIKRDERGLGHLEILLGIVMVAIISFTGWYVYHTKQNSDKALNAASSTSNNAGPRFAKTAKSDAAAGPISNASLQSDQQSAASSANRSQQDLSATNNSLNDQSTFTSVPQ